MLFAILDQIDLAMFNREIMCQPDAFLCPVNDVKVSNILLLGMRMYQVVFAAVHGLNKKEACNKYIKQQVHKWHGSYDTPLPMAKIALLYQKPGALDYLTVMDIDKELKDSQMASLQFGNFHDAQYVKMCYILMVELHKGATIAICGIIFPMVMRSTLYTLHRKVYDNGDEYVLEATTMNAYLLWPLVLTVTCCWFSFNFSFARTSYCFSFQS
ncbi:hypothetical protein RYX36_033402 [Vicia faba]